LPVPGVNSDWSARPASCCDMCWKVFWELAMS
jgi:hypothetical protein